MVNYQGAFTRPFTDVKKLLIGIALNIVPIINFFAVGYIIESGTTAMKKHFILPEWKDWGLLFARGFLASVISLLYMLIPFIVLFIGGGMGIWKIFITGDFSDIVIATPYLIISGVLFLLAFYLMPVALLQYAEQYKFKDAFTFNKLSKRVFQSTHFSAWFIAALIFYLIYAITSFIPVVGPAIGSFIGGIILFTIIGEIYPTL